ncbi:MAG: hypothetical protein Q8K30_04985 [Candidatus Gracilibacteria bacterium]|nr:hypothetical protein [Candidatus Gracilibacteria bacterium]
MKNLKKIISIIILICGMYWYIQVNAAIDLRGIQGVENITNHSLQNLDSGGDIVDNVESIGFSILTIIKYIVSGLLVIFLVYVGIQMIISMGNDEEKLSTAKRQLRYTIVAIIFINIPGTIYNMFVTNKGQIDGRIIGTWSSQISQQSDNLFINIFNFDRGFNSGIVLFLESLIFSIAIFVIMLAGIKILTSRGREEEISEAKNKILWSIIGLIFIGFIEAWQAFIYNGQIRDGANLFATIEELALFFAGPVAIFFLTLAGWYYITSNGDDEKVKKAKSIIVNIIIATIILLASHAFLKDLITLII